MDDLTFSEWLTGERKHKSLILKRMKGIRTWLEVMEEMLSEEDRRKASRKSV